MAQKIVICCDGTWNTPRSQTNVFRTYTFLQERLRNPAEEHRGEGVRVCRGQAADGTETSIFYDQGVGTNFFDRLVGGATGLGLSENVRDAYHFLAHEFSPGAEIYVFGFSRGAYTARSLCGFIKAAGLLQQPDTRDVYRAYLDYYATAERVIARPQGWSFSRVREQLIEGLGNLVGELFGPDLDEAPRHDNVKIRLIGVYDTVGALGVPLPDAAQVNEAVVGFHDTTLSDLIEHAVHALAVDEKRGPYIPTLWTLGPDQGLAPEQTVLPVWFPGVHSDIGGGYHDRGIGDYTLDFMLRQAAHYGLVLDPAQPSPDLPLTALPAQHESFNETWRLLSGKLHLVPAGQRTIGTTVQGPQGQILQVAGEVQFHRLLAERFGQQVDIILDEDNNEQQIQEYSPPNAASGLLPTFA